MNDVEDIMVCQLFKSGVHVGENLDMWKTEYKNYLGKLEKYCEEGG